VLEGGAAGFAPERDYPGTQARLIVCAGGGDPCQLRKTFELAGRAAQAVLHLAARDALELHANGRPSAALACSGGFQKLERRLETQLRPGRNELSVTLASCSSRPLAGVFLELLVIEDSPG
jgi:hypothetical protein